MSQFVVDSTTFKDQNKRVAVRDGNSRPAVLSLHRYAVVGKGDVLVFDKEHPKNIFVLNVDNAADPIRISPHYERDENISIGNVRVAAKVTEVVTAADLQAVNYLEQYHYRTLDSDPGDSSETRATVTATGGRRGILLLYLRIGGAWRAAGYVELQMPLLMVKPRHELFAAPFQHPDRPIKWDKWDQYAIRKYVNLIVRIARIVTAPEYRGLSLSKILIQAAKQFAQQRWHIGGRRPIFIEISAEMLNHIDFVSSSAFVLIGKTEGNLSRVVADLASMQKGYVVSSGIMSLQKKYLNAILEYCRHSGHDFQQVLTRLEKITGSTEPLSELTPDEWLAFRSVLRFPIPYYLCPVDEYSANYLAAQKIVPAAPPPSPFKADFHRVSIGSLTVQAEYQIPRTKYTRLVMDAFGLKSADLRQRIVDCIDIEASSGNIFFVAGSSGSGKTVLLRALDPADLRPESTIVRSYKGTLDFSAAWLRPLPSDVPVFAYFAERYSPQRAFSALSQVGLSEAFVFLKPFPMLSRGQRYRAMLADILLRDDAVWLIDEFCADLDPMTAKIVAHNLRKQVLRTGRICFVAAANHAHFIDALRPTRVIVLTQGQKASIMSYGDYRDEFLAEAS